MDFAELNGFYFARSFRKTLAANGRQARQASDADTRVAGDE